MGEKGDVKRGWMLFSMYLLEFFLGIPNADWPNTEHAQLPRSIMGWEQPLHFEGQANERVSDQSMRGGGNKQLSLSFPAARSCVFFRVPLTRDFSQYPLNGDLAHRLLGFHYCERWWHHHHNGSVNSKCTQTPKRICQVLTSPLALEI